MLFWQFVQAHKSEIWGSLSSLLFLASEYLGTTDRFKSNSLVQLAKSYFKQQSDQAPKP